jgi:hypothetical protein
MWRVESRRPPGVSMRITTTVACSSRAESSACSRKRAETLSIGRSSWMTTTGAPSDAARAEPATARQMTTNTRTTSDRSARESSGRLTAFISSESYSLERKCPIPLGGA